MAVSDAEFAAVEARVTLLEDKVATLQAQMLVAASFRVKARLLLIAMWRKLVNRNPTSEEL